MGRNVWLPALETKFQKEVIVREQRPHAFHSLNQDIHQSTSITTPWSTTQSTFHKAASLLDGISLQPGAAGDLPQLGYGNVLASESRTTARALALSCGPPTQHVGPFSHGQPWATTQNTSHNDPALSRTTHTKKDAAGTIPLSLLGYRSVRGPAGRTAGFRAPPLSSEPPPQQIVSPARPLVCAGRGALDTPKKGSHLGKSGSNNTSTSSLSQRSKRPERSGSVSTAHSAAPFLAALLD